MQPSMRRQPKQGAYGAVEGKPVKSIHFRILELVAPPKVLLLLYCFSFLLLAFAPDAVPFELGEGEVQRWSFFAGLTQLGQAIYLAVLAFFTAGIASVYRTISADGLAAAFRPLPEEKRKPDAGDAQIAINLYGISGIAVCLWLTKVAYDKSPVIDYNLLGTFLLSGYFFELLIRHPSMKASLHSLRELLYSNLAGFALFVPFFLLAQLIGDRPSGGDYMAWVAERDEMFRKLSCLYGASLFGLRLFWLQLWDSRYYRKERER
jgi:hypothetical protein